VEPEDNQRMKCHQRQFQKHKPVRNSASQLRNRCIPDGTYGGVKECWVNYLITQLLLDLNKYIRRLKVLNLSYWN